MAGTWQLPIIQAFTAHWEMQIKQMATFLKLCSNITNFKFFDWSSNMRLISKCLAFAATEAPRKLSNQILEQRETSFQSFCVYNLCEWLTERKCWSNWMSMRLSAPYWILFKIYNLLNIHLSMRCKSLHFCFIILYCHIVLS